MNHEATAIGRGPAPGASEPGARAKGARRVMIAKIAALVTAVTLIASPAAAQAKPPETRLLQVIMIEATMSDLPAEGIPRAAMQSLADMRDILPYKGYRLLDTALLRTASHADATLNGPGGRPFRVNLSMDQPREGVEGPDLFFRSFRVSETTREVPPEPQRAPSDSGEEARAPRASRTLISTSFGMDIGETLIVGSSRLDGDQTALILLVTALP